MLPTPPPLIRGRRSFAAPARDATPVPRSPTRWRVLRFIGSLLWAAIYAAMFVSPMGGVHADPALRLAHLGVAVAMLVLGVGDLRARVLLERDAVLVIRGFKRTRVAWGDVRQVRLRDGGFGPGWVELVRISSRRVVRLPVDIQQYPALRKRWAAATTSAGGARRTR